MASVEEDSLIEETLKDWDEFHSGILRISGRAEEFIAQSGAKYSSSEYSENITGVKLPLLELPKCSGNVLECSAFYDAFLASVESNKILSNVQKFTHLRSCLNGRAYKCIEGYAVTNDNYPKALQDLRGRFGRKRLLVNELVKSILNLDVPVKTDGKSLRHLYDTLQNRMRSLESLAVVTSLMTTLAYPWCCFLFLTRSYHVSSKRNGSSSSRNMTMMKMTKRSISRNSFNSWKVTCSVKRLTII